MRLIYVRGRAGSVLEISVFSTEISVSGLEICRCYDRREFALFLKFGARTCSQDLWLSLISETGLKFLI